MLLPPAYPKISSVSLPGAGENCWTSPGMGCGGVRERSVTPGQGSWFSSSSLSLPSPCAGSLRYAGITPGRARATQTMRAGEYPRFLRVLLLVRAGSFPLGRILLPPYPRGQDERAPLCHVPFSLKSPPMLQKEPFWRWSSCSSLGGCSSSLGIRAAAGIVPPWRLPVWLHELRHGLGMDQPGLRDTD